MPAPVQLLQGLREIANAWKPLAVVWHVYFGVLAIALLAGIRPAKRPCGLALALPLISVSALAWTAKNPFNGLVFALIAVLVIFFSIKLPCQPVRIARPAVLIPGIILFAFGWLYPHFLATKSLLPYLYSAPTGLIPCPTLSIAIGLFLVLDGLGSKALSILFALSGLFYGLFGMFRLGVTIDVILALGAVVTLLSLASFPEAAPKKGA